MDGGMKRKVAASVAAGLAVAGGGAAVAATQAGSPAEESKAVIEDAAKQLGVEPSKLSDALEQALENRVDAAVAAGRITQEQGERMKERLRSGELPLLGRGGPHLGGHGHFGRHLEAAAGYLGTTEAALREKLRAGTTLAQAARDAGKSVDGLVDALVADERKELDEAVAAGRLTEARKQELVEGLRERVTALVNGERPAGLPGRPGRGAFGHGVFGHGAFGHGGPGEDAAGPWS